MGVGHKYDCVQIYLLTHILLTSCYHFIPSDSVVKFDTAEEAQRAIEMFNGRPQPDGPPLEVRCDRTRK